jgi:drug/metabolite transporter (DMT)-like permease
MSGSRSVAVWMTRGALLSAAVLAAVLALLSSLSWGLSDFLGGFQSRRHALLAVLVLSQGLALALLVVAVLAGAPTEHDTASTLWAASVGGLGLLGLMAFYRALSIGTMSVVAPISATGVSIPVLVGLASGERPGAVQVAGIGLACIGVILAAREAPSEDADIRRSGRVAIGLALLAAIGFGSFFAGIDRAEETGDVAWVLLSARTADVLILLAACAVVRPKLPTAPAALGAIAAVGVFDLLANLLFVIAAGRGLLSVVGVLGSLYPAVTVVLARVVLHERLTRTQNAGVLVTLAGVVALAAGG